MSRSDLPDVTKIAHRSFPDHFENGRIFAERFSLYPRGCLSLDGSSFHLAGYLISYPWTAGSAPPLNTLIREIPVGADVLYLHDLALDTAIRGKGLAAVGVERLLAEARADGWLSVALVAVNNAQQFWETLGFKPARGPGLGVKLAGYGIDAQFMTRSL